MISLSQKADELFDDEIKPLMVALQYDRLMEGGVLYTDEELFQRAVTLQMYAISKGKKLIVDPETKLVIMQ